MSMQNTSRISKAVAETRRQIPGYFESTLAMHAGISEKAMGSIVEGVTPEQLERVLLTAEWEEYSHPSVMAGSVAFKASISGRLGVVELRSLPSDTVVVLEDPKETGQVSAVIKGVRGPEVDFTVLILGVEPGEIQEIVWTFHPGDPIRASQVSAEGLHGKTVSVQEALGMGLEFAKVQ